jgi:hypothetical protein
VTFTLRDATFCSSTSFSPVQKHFSVDITNLGYVEGGECLKLFVPEENAMEATKLKGQEEQEGEEGGTSLVGHPVLTPELQGQAQEGCSCIRGGRRGGGDSWNSPRFYFPSSPLPFLFFQNQKSTREAPGGQGG